MNDNFAFDLYLCYSSKDNAEARSLAERLRADGLNVWFNEWEIKSSDSVPSKIEEGLDRSRAMLLCMSNNAFGSDWKQLEAGTFRFRDPLNKNRRFIPLRLDDSPIKGSLAQFLYINWRPAVREKEYANLLAACRSGTTLTLDSPSTTGWLAATSTEIVSDRETRDNFPQRVKDTLAKRVASFCSNPACRCLTSGPHSNPNKAVNVGVAAHITAASPRGPRYHAGLSQEKRASIQNAIWLCQNCAKLIDNDEARFSTHKLHEWKEEAEAFARQKLEVGHSVVSASDALEVLHSDLKEETSAIRTMLEEQTASGRTLRYAQSVLNAFRQYEQIGISDREVTNHAPPEIWNIYVEPGCSTNPITPREMETAQSKRPIEDPAEELLPILCGTTEKRLVLLGDPGMGKSTLVQRLAAGLSSALLEDGGLLAPNSDSIPDSATALRGYIAVPIILRDVVPHLAGRLGTWTWDTLCHCLYSKYRRETHAPLIFADVWPSFAQFQSELLQQPHLFFLVDGLDEIGDIEKRERIRDLIWEGFQRHKHARWLVTSRVIGYGDARVDHASITVKTTSNATLSAEIEKWKARVPGVAGPPEFHSTKGGAYACVDYRITALRYLAPFNNVQQAQFLDRWFEPRDQAHRSKSLLTEVRGCRHEGLHLIARVPNLLTYLAILKNTEPGRHLPEGRALLYQRIVEAYLHHLRELYRSDELGHVCPFTSDQCRKLLSLLAAVMQNNRATVSDSSKYERADTIAPDILISETKVIDILQNEVNRILGGSEESGRRSTSAVIQEFLGYIARRSGLLIPRGLDSDGALYAFTHLSFLEYFAALYLQDRRLDDLKRSQALRRRRHTAEQWAHTHLNDPLKIATENFAKWSTQITWHEVLVFLAESYQEDDDDLLDLLHALFPSLSGIEDPTYPVKVREYAPDNWQPLVSQNTLDLALRLLRDRHLRLAPSESQPRENLPDRQFTAILWMERLWHAWMRIRCWKDKHPWWIAPKLLDDEHLRPLAESSLHRALNTADAPISLNLYECESLANLPTLPDSLELLSLRGRRDLRTIPELPTKLQLLSLHDCPRLEKLPALPDELRELDLTDCESLTELPALPECLQKLYISGCSTLTQLPPLPRDLKLLRVTDCREGVKTEARRWRDERVSLEVDGI